MRVFVCAVGTRGDFELFLLLALALRRRGHAVVLGTSPCFVERAHDAGLDTVTVGRGSLDELRALVRSLAAVQDRTARTYAFYTRWLRRELDAGMPAITRAAAGADYVVNNLKLLLRRDDGDVIPSAAITYDPPARLEDLERYATAEHGGRVIDLVAMPKALIDPHDRVGDRYVFTGFWLPSTASESAPSPDLAAFIDAGAPPVVLTMGSMITFDAAAFLRDLMDASREMGTRAVVVGGWADRPALDLPAELVHWVPDAPYGWLFPRSLCIVHHGGTGTLAAVIRAGRPSIVMPQILAQEIYARRLAEAGLLAGLIDLADFAPVDLARMIDRARTDEALRDACRRWQRVVELDGGVEAAVDHIEAHHTRVMRW